MKTRIKQHKRSKQILSCCCLSFTFLTTFSCVQFKILHKRKILLWPCASEEAKERGKPSFSPCVANVSFLSQFLFALSDCQVIYTSAAGVYFYLNTWVVFSVDSYNETHHILWINWMKACNLSRLRHFYLQSHCPAYWEFWFYLVFLMTVTIFKTIYF